MTGWEIFTVATTAVNAAGLTWYARDVARAEGGAAAARAALVVGPSAAVYPAVCWFFGFGPGAQFTATVASLLPLWLGRKWIAIPAQYRWLISLLSGKEDSR